MSLKELKYQRPMLYWHCVKVEAGYYDSIGGEMSEIDGTKDEGEW